MFIRFNTKGLGKTRGFTLFELLVSISIFVLITALALVNYRRYTNDLVVSNLAYDIALTVRKAQSYGINVRGFGGNFNYAYGVHFDNPTSVNNQYKLFVDVNQDGVYDATTDGSSSAIETYTLLQGNKVCKLRYVHHNETQEGDITKLDVTYLRPNPEATIIINGTQLLNDPTVSGDYVRVYISSPEGRQKTIDIYPSGQISVTNPATPVPSCSS